MAGARFYTTLVEMCQERGAKKDSEFPETILYSISSDALDNAGIVHGVRLEEELIKRIGSLHHEFLCENVLIACNTAHAYQANFHHLFPGVVISLLDSAIRACDGKKYGVICSRTTRDKKLYGEAVYCSDDEQLEVDEVIQRIIEGSETDYDRQSVAAMGERMFRSGCEKLILGCTELLVLLHPVNPNIIDPARTAIAEALD